MRRFVVASASILFVAAVTLAALPATNRTHDPLAALPVTQSGNVCLQDQYGNLYSFVIDETNQYVYGTVDVGPDCPTPIWPLSGSYVRVAGQLVLELTAANPDERGSCVPIFKLKGVYPDFAWYYFNGYGGQEATYVPCGTQVRVRTEKGGIWGL